MHLGPDSEIDAHGHETRNSLILEEMIDLAFVVKHCVSALKNKT